MVKKMNYTCIGGPNVLFQFFYLLLFYFETRFLFVFQLSLMLRQVQISSALKYIRFSDIQALVLKFDRM